MKTSLCKLFSLAVIGLLAALPAAADDLAAFAFDAGVMVGSTTLPAGVYVFRTAGDRNVVVVYDEAQTKVVASAIALRRALDLDELHRSGTMAHDWAVRAFSLGRYEYSFAPSRKPAALASRPVVVTTAIALAR